MNIEEKLKITRQIREIIYEYRFPVHILTKSTLVTRDFDLIREILKQPYFQMAYAQEMVPFLTISLSTLDRKLAKKVEPGAPPPEERLEIIKKAKSFGIKTGIAFIPNLPFLSDSKNAMGSMLYTSKKAGADYIFVGTLTLFGNSPQDSRVSFYRFIEKSYPHLFASYQKMYGISFSPPGNYTKRLYEMWKTETTRQNLHVGLPGCET